MNLLSIGASFGVVVAVFQGAGATELLGRPGAGRSRPSSR